MRFKLYLNEKIKFNDEMVGTQSGQSDLRLTASIDGKLAGYIDYSDYRGEISIKYIEVLEGFKGQRVGTELILQLQKTYPKTEIDWGGLTGDGAKLYKSVKSKLYVDTKRIKKINSLKKEYKALEKEEKELTKKVEKGIRVTDKEGDRFNYIADRMYEIEEELNSI